MRRYEISYHNVTVPGFRGTIAHLYYQYGSGYTTFVSVRLGRFIVYTN